MSERYRVVTSWSDSSGTNCGRSSILRMRSSRDDDDDDDDEAAAGAGSSPSSSSRSSTFDDEYATRREG